MRLPRAGLTLVESTLLVSLVGIALAVAVPTFIDHVEVSKLSEASRELSRIHAAAANYYATPQSTQSGRRLGCLPEPAGPTPAVPSSDPTQVVFGAKEGPGAATWLALGYEPESSIRFRYSFLPSRTGCDPADAARDTPLVRLRAEGDLDGDGNLSLFELACGDEGGELVPEPPLTAFDRVE